MRGCPSEIDERYMNRARACGQQALLWASPNPAVGAVVVSDRGVFEGRSGPPGEAHAELTALQAAGSAATGSTLYTTLEPCAHLGRTPACTHAIISAGVTRVVAGIKDPDRSVNGKGIAMLESAGLEVTLGVRAEEITADLAAYLTHRRLGRPHVILKLAATLDGRIAASDGSSRWITGRQARADAHRLRAYSDAVLVGAGTARADDPSLTVRHFDPPEGVSLGDLQPLRVVLGSAPARARLRPALELSGDLRDVLGELAGRGVLQLLVEGGAGVAGDFHRAGLVDSYVFYLAPALAGGGAGLAPLGGAAPEGISDVWRGEITDVRRLGEDIRVTLQPRRPHAHPGGPEPNAASVREC